MNLFERLALLIGPELLCHIDRKLARLLKRPQLTRPQTGFEDLKALAARGVDRKQSISVAQSDRIASGHTILIVGSTSAGKT